ncbi:MAG TPA: hypothetical protein VFW12_00605 [Candidatus Limnocylindria bacterium]|nr:hypothetical protein [Candidatus Limnocylindria bacterium]
MRNSRRSVIAYLIVAVIAFTAGSGRLAEAAAGGLTALEARVTAAEASLLSLGGQLAGEAAARAQAIADALAAAKAYTDQQVANEASARQAADNTLQSSVSAEAGARQGADAQLQTNIDNEAAARTAADQVLQNNLNAQATARQNADAALQVAISNETAARQGADTALQGNINAEATARQSGDATTLASAKAYTDSKLTTIAPRLESRLVVGAAVGVGVGEFKSAEAECAADEVVTGGGFRSDGVSVGHSPYQFGTGSTKWVVRGFATLGGTLVAHAICTKIVL